MHHQRAWVESYCRTNPLNNLSNAMAELIAGIDGTAYSVRRSLHNVKEILRARKAIRRAFLAQQAGLGLAFVELLSNCPTNWGCTPAESLEWIETRLVSYFPLGDYQVLPAIAALA